ncbi:hypothetical protein [Musicola keenii]|uniref:hypothetical protein n=1 Tax=Musicola keenii TaxID=2884250 RepID=UPI001784CA46|nr:hypothetical protein [Musicola keenii]
MRRITLSTFMFAFLSFASTASTSITIDAKKNCLAAPSDSTMTSGSSAIFQLEQGRYVLSLVSNSMNCSSLSSITCPIDVVMVAGGMKNARWGISVTSTPVVVDSTTTSFIAYISDNNCYDNVGQATLLIQKSE